MMDSIHIDRIIVAVVSIALIFTATFTFYPQALGIEGSGTEPEYGEKLFQKQKIASINLTVTEEVWAGMLENALNEEYVSCDITINGETLEAVGIRPKGNSSLTQVARSEESDRFSIKIKFDEYVDGQNYYGLKEMIINNMQGDVTYMKEYLSYELFDYMGVDTPLYAFSDISLNGEPWGFYLAVETIDESFAQRVYGMDHGELYKPEFQEMAGGGDMKKDGMEAVTNGAIREPEQRPEGMVPGERPEGMESKELTQDAGGGADLVYLDDKVGSYSQTFDNAVFHASDSDKNKVMDALKALSTGEDLETYVDTDQVLRYFAVNTALVNLDSYVCSFKHNYYLYEEEGMLSILPWDLNLSFAGFQSKSSTEAVNFPIDTPVTSGISLEERPLIGTLLEKETNQQVYHQYLQQITSEYFASGLFQEKINQLDGLIKDHVARDATSFCTIDEYEKGVGDLQAFGELRGESLQGQLDGTIPSTYEGQASEPDKLIDASAISISGVGFQGMGNSQPPEMR